MRSRLGKRDGLAEVSLILVTYRSAAVAGAAISSFRREVAALGAVGEVVVVDHSADPAEAERLVALAPQRLLELPNRGYAAGINAGVAAASGDVLLLANPDVELAPGALAALIAPLEAGWDLVGPQFYLADFLFPPADLQAPGEELRRWLAGVAPALGRRHLRREVERWRRVWEAAGPVSVPALSGALLAARAATVRRLGPWDEGYFLYFEESDWLRRAVAAGCRLAVAPAARVRHSWGHAAPPAVRERAFAASRRRFYRHAWGALGAWLAALPPPVPTAPPPLPDGERLPAEALWLLSPSPLGFPAAAASGLGSGLEAALERFAAARSHPGALTLTACDPATGRLEGPWAWPR